MFSFDHCEKFVINLAHRQDRLDSFMEQLRHNGFEPEDFHRIEAVHDTDFGGLGCSKSHLLALTQFIAQSNKHYCAIFEDDFSFRQSASTCEKILQTLNDNTTWNVFLFAGTELQSFGTGCTEQDHAIDRVFESATASGYLLTRQYAQVLIQNLLEGIWGMEKYRGIEQRKIVYHRFALDRTWNRLQNKDSWFCTQPMLGQQTSSYSDIEKRAVDYSDISA